MPPAWALAVHRRPRSAAGGGPAMRLAPLAAGSPRRSGQYASARLELALSARSTSSGPRSYSVTCVTRSASASRFGRRIDETAPRRRGVARVRRRQCSRVRRACTVAIRFDIGRAHGLGDDKVARHPSRAPRADAGRRAAATPPPRVRSTSARRRRGAYWRARCNERTCLHVGLLTAPNRP